MVVVVDGGVSKSVTEINVHIIGKLITDEPAYCMTPCVGSSV